VTTTVKRVASPPIICVVGKKKSGKTTTVVGLVCELVSRGYRVMTAKHGHNFEIDTAGTDSWRHRREAGASRVVLASPEKVAVMGDWDEGGEQELEELVSAYLSDADIVVAEGFRSSSAARIEVFREGTHERAYYGSDSIADARYLAVLTDALGFEADVPVMDMDAPECYRWVADLVEARLLGSASNRASPVEPHGADAPTPGSDRHRRHAPHHRSSHTLVP
jgi:molybdopterin-guanine dinucleotide biosynthesis adapter protein